VELLCAMSDEQELPEPGNDGTLDDFAVVVRRYQGRVLAVLHRYERDPQRLEDLAQETFVKAWRALDTFDRRAPFEHWISRIAVRVALDHLRREKRRRPEVALPDLGPDALDWLQSGDENAQLAARDAAELLKLALRELSPTDQVIITLLEIEERSVRDIAALLGMSSIAVRVRALRARLKLRQAVEKWQTL
jgi:RNA polymerase sigma-70 factor (ECF subfamily)